MKTTTTPMKATIVLITLLAISGVASYGSDDALKAEIMRQSEQRKEEVKALESEIARQRLILQALEARLQAMKEGPKQPDSRAFVEIKVDGSSYTIDGKQTDKEEILSAIQAKAGDDRSWPVVIRYTAATPYEQLQPVLQACAKGGFHNVALVKPTKENG